MTVVEIIIAELHCLSNGGHRVDCSSSYVRDGLTKNKENAQYVPAPEQKMFRDRTEPTFFRAGTVPETVPVQSLAGIVSKRLNVGSHKQRHVVAQGLVI